MIALDRDFDCLVLTEHKPLQIPTNMGDHLGIALRHCLRRNARHDGNGRLDLLRGDLLLPLAFRQQHLRRTRLVDHIDRLVGKLPVVDVLGRQLDRRLDGFVRVLELVIVLEDRLQAFQDLDRIFDGRLLHIDLLEPANKRPILLEVLTVLLVGRGADAPKRSGLQRRLQQVRGVHSSARRRTRTDDGVDLVDEKDRAWEGFDLLHHGLEPFLEIAAIPRAGEQRPHIEGEDRRAFENVRNLAADNLSGEPFGDRRLADARVAD